MFLAHLAYPLAYLAVPDHFLWDYVKSKAYGIPPANRNELERQIWECTEGFPKEMPKHVKTSFLLQLQEFIEQHGSHIQSVIF
jgi:hypothetical protein